mmetsp:Transcript_11798/g.25311  ORF Transcript_11798/g.25311 Transcript_11798/m.25311 type:complete len:134 (-) Transcript_11798:196-597(-)
MCAPASCPPPAAPHSATLPPNHHKYNCTIACVHAGVSSSWLTVLCFMWRGLVEAGMSGGTPTPHITPMSHISLLTSHISHPYFTRITPFFHTHHTLVHMRPPARPLQGEGSAEAQNIQLPCGSWQLRSCSGYV